MKAKRVWLGVLVIVAVLVVWSALLPPARRSRTPPQGIRSENAASRFVVTMTLTNPPAPASK